MRRSDVMKARLWRIDQHVGVRICAIRKHLGIKQKTVARHLGVSFQQVQKYERGQNRLSASRLLRLTELFNVPLGYFYQGLPGDTVEDAASVAQQNRKVRDFWIDYGTLNGFEQETVHYLIRHLIAGREAGLGGCDLLQGTGQ